MFSNLSSQAWLEAVDQLIITLRFGLVGRFKNDRKKPNSEIRPKIIGYQNPVPYWIRIQIQAALWIKI